MKNAAVLAPWDSHKAYSAAIFRKYAMSFEQWYGRFVQAFSIKRVIPPTLSWFLRKNLPRISYVGADLERFGAI